MASDAECILQANSWVALTQSCLEVCTHLAQHISHRSLHAVSCMRHDMCTRSSARSNESAANHMNSVGPRPSSPEDSYQGTSYRACKSKLLHNLSPLPASRNVHPIQVRHEVIDKNMYAFEHGYRHPRARKCFKTFPRQDIVLEDEMLKRASEERNTHFKSHNEVFRTCVYRVRVHVMDCAHASVKHFTKCI